MEKMVMLKNMVDSMVSVRKPEYGVNRRWNRRGQTVGLPKDVVEQLLWDGGFRRMIDSGILYIEDLEMKKELGLEPEEATSPVNIIALSEADMERLLKKTSLAKFKKELANLPDTQIDNLIDYAIANKIAEADKCSYLKKVTKRDILLAISRAEDIAAEEAAEKNKALEEGRRV